MDETQAVEAAENGRSHDIEEDEAHPRRLPLLWILCVLLGLGGFSLLTLAVLGTPLGMAVWGGLALLNFVLAVGLWRRSNAARIAVMWLCAIGICLQVVGYAVSGRWDGWQLIVVAFWLAAIVYLFLRRDYFRPPDREKPGLRRPSAYVALAVVLVFGISFLLLSTVDDPAREFPALRIEQEDIPEAQNAYPILLELGLSWEEGGEPEWARLDELRRSADGTPEWRAEAQAFLDANQEALKAADAMLARARYQAPPQTRPVPWGPSRAAPRGLAALLVLESDLQMSRAELREAMETARRAIELGCLVTKGNSGYMDWLTSVACIQKGLSQVREVALAPGAEGLVLLQAVEPVRVSVAARKGLGRALAVEYQMERAMLAAMKDLDLQAMGLPAEDHDIPEDGWSRRLLRDQNPMVKLNMSSNFLGEELMKIRGSLDRFAPPNPGQDVGSFDYLISNYGLLHLLRNPMGDICILMALPAQHRGVELYSRLTGEARATRVYLALREYHVKTGELPIQLTELVSGYLESLPVDPFTQQPFVYQPEADPPLLICVGPDREVDAPHGPSQADDDLALELTFAGRPPAGE